MDMKPQVPWDIIENEIVPYLISLIDIINFLKAFEDIHDNIIKLDKVIYYNDMIPLLSWNVFKRIESIRYLKCMKSIEEIADDFDVSRRKVIESMRIVEKLKISCSDLKTIEKLYENVEKLFVKNNVKSESNERHNIVLENFLKIEGEKICVNIIPKYNNFGELFICSALAKIESEGINTFKRLTYEPYDRDSTIFLNYSINVLEFVYKYPRNQIPCIYSLHKTRVIRFIVKENKNLSVCKWITNIPAKVCMIIVEIEGKDESTYCFIKGRNEYHYMFEKRVFEGKNKISFEKRKMLYWKLANPQ